MYLWLHTLARELPLSRHFYVNRDGRQRALGDSTTSEEGGMGA